MNSPLSISSQANPDDEYVIEKITKEKTKKGIKYYFVKWQGYDSSQNTWEPESSLKKVKHFIEEFNDNNKNNKQQIEAIVVVDEDADKEERKQSPSNQKQKNQSQSKKQLSRQKIKSTYTQFKEDEIIPQYKGLSQQNKAKVKQLGDYAHNDSAEEILDLKKGENQNETLFLVSWKRRARSGIVPLPAWISCQNLKMHNPEIFSDFLMERIKVPVNKNQEEKN